MVPGCDVVAFAVRIVLQADGGREVAVGKLWVERFDFVVQVHVALLTSAAESQVKADPFCITGVAPVKKP